MSQISELCKEIFQHGCRWKFKGIVAIFLLIATHLEIDLAGENVTKTKTQLCKASVVNSQFIRPFNCDLIKPKSFIYYSAAKWIPQTVFFHSISSPPLAVWWFSWEFLRRRICNRTAAAARTNKTHTRGTIIDTTKDGLSTSRPQVSSSNNISNGEVMLQLAQFNNNNINSLLDL